MNIDELLNRYADGERDFGAINLHSANLTGLELSGVNLKGANLSSAQLRGVNLSGANLSGANLTASNLSAADLNLANLSEANLSSVQMEQTNLREADLNTGASRICQFTFFTPLASPRCVGGNHSYSLPLLRGGLGWGLLFMQKRDAS
jgi:hypothetical protein